MIWLCFPVPFALQLENLQKRIYQLEEQLHSEMQLKDEMEQKCRSVPIWVTPHTLSYFRLPLVFF